MRQKLWKIVRKTDVVQFHFNTVTEIQSTAYHRGKNCAIDTFWKCPEGKMF